MATQFTRMIKNSHFGDLGASVGGKGIVSKVQKKRERKPLGEISNSNVMKPPQNHVSKKQQNPVDFTYLEDDKGALKSTLPYGGRKSVSKAAKNVLGSTRKPLSDISNSRKPLNDISNSRKPLNDISNSRKPALPQISEKSKIKNADALDLVDSGIGCKGFLHNHAECVKTQIAGGVDMNYYLETIGLHNGSSLDVTCSEYKLPSSREEDLEFEDEISELRYEECSPQSIKVPSYKKSDKFNWSPPSKALMSPSLNMLWDNSEALEFCLAESP